MLLDAGYQRWSLKNSNGSYLTLDGEAVCWKMLPDANEGSMTVTDPAGRCMTVTDASGHYMDDTGERPWIPYDD